MKRHVALIIETSSIYGRDLLSGIVRFMRIHDDWSVFLEQRDLTKKLPSWLARWKGDGIISRATTPQLVSAVKESGVPLVDLTDRHENMNLICVRSDDVGIGKLGAEHLLERGFRRFGFCGFTGEAWSMRRQLAFSEAIQNQGGTVDVYHSAWFGRGARAWEDEQRHLGKWLQGMQPPFGIMACNDVRGQHIVDACIKEQYVLPEEVAVVGVDNDALLCSVCDPPLSSVIPNPAGVGFRAAELLSRMMKGEHVSNSEHLVEPLGVATRQSTDVVAIDDAELALALQYIRKNACRGLNVDDVTRQIAISRSSLERKVRRYLGRTPQQEIRNVQIKRAKELLANSDMPAEQIATLCGFEHPEYFYVVFKRVASMTPGEFRSRAQPQ